MTDIRKAYLAIAIMMVMFVALAFPGAGRRGVTSEEVQPYLDRHPFVVDLAQGRIQPLPPYEPGAPAPPRWVATSQWPVLAYDGQQRQWPVFIRGHQTAIGTYVGLLLGPLLGGGVAGIQRSSVLLTLLLIPLVYLLARRSSTFRHGSTTAILLAPALVALSFGTLFFGRTGYAFEIASRVAMVATLVAASPLTPLTRRRALVIGLLAGLAIACRATIAVTLAPALAILLAHPARVASWSRRALIPIMMAALPLAIVGIFSLVAPFFEGTQPLAGFPFYRLAKHVTQIPAHLVMQLAWLGDAQSILGPIRSNAPLAPPPVAAALLGAIPVVFSILRWWQGKAGDGERMLVAALMGNVVGGALLYGEASQFQLAMALDPLVAIAVAQQVAHFAASRPAAIVAAMAIAVRAQSVALGLALDTNGTNPMFSGRTQQSVVNHLSSLGAHGQEVLTTTYDHAGVIEAWTDGRIRPIHAWPVLRAGPQLATRMTKVLQAYQPRYVLLSQGINPFDGPFTDNEATHAALVEAIADQGMHIEQQWDFPTEAGAPGWHIVEISAPSSQP